MWRYSRAAHPLDPEQGWKLHISATVLTANDVLEKVAPFLRKRGILFKATASLYELHKLNSGLFYGYSQVGKFITVYPQTTEEAVLLARRLHHLTRRMTAPEVPFDLRFRPDSCIYYRYGAFKPLDLLTPDKTRVPAIRDPRGNLVPDSREAEEAKPGWISDPFPDKRLRPQSATIESPLKTTFRAFRALVQRGKGGVYHALDLSVQPPRLCVLKEGRACGEINWDGRDGYWMVKNEERVLSLLRAAGIEVPRIYSSFEVEKHYYLATEFIEGDNLQVLLSKKQRRLPVARALLYGAQLADIISQVHAAGWVWRDCKPTNLIVTKKGHLRPLDFEGACPISSLEPLHWSTPGFTPPAWHNQLDASSGMTEDLYALGTIIYLLLTGSLPDDSAPVPVWKLRRNVPPLARDLISELMSTDPQRRPAAQIVAQELRALLPALHNVSST